MVDVELVHAADLVLVRHEAGQQDVADVLQADRAVEVDEDADGRAGRLEGGLEGGLAHVTLVHETAEPGPATRLPVIHPGRG